MGIKQASFATDNTEIPLIEQTSCDDSKKYIKEIIKSNWQNIWNEPNEIKRDACRWQNTNVIRKEETVLNRLRIGHTGMHSWTADGWRRFADMSNLWSRFLCQAHRLRLPEICSTLNLTKYIS